MRYRACVISRDPDFAQFVRLTLLSRVRPVIIATDDTIPEADIYVVDLDTVSLPLLTGQVLLTSAHLDKPADCPHLWADRPFRPARLLALLDLTEDAPPNSLVPDADRHSVLVGDTEVSLSAKEFSLFMALWEADENYVTRDELLKTVWQGEEADPGVVNVYIHYLRRKLEFAGHRYLYAARGYGYRLTKGESPC